MTISFAMLYMNYQTAVKQARIDAKNTSYIVDQNIQSILNKVYVSLLSLSQFLDVDKKNRHKISLSAIEAMDFYKKTLPEVYAFRMAAADGKVQLNTDRDVSTGLSIGDRIYFQYHQKYLSAEATLNFYQ